MSCYPFKCHMESLRSNEIIVCNGTRFHIFSQFSHFVYVLHGHYFMAPAWESRKWILIGTWYFYVGWLCYVEQRYLLWAATTLGAEQTLSWMGHLGECKVRNIYLLPHSNFSMKSIIRSLWHSALAILFIGGLDLEFLFKENSPRATGIWPWWSFKMS